MNRKRIIVVIGMHRSGTSALTRGLQVLDVGLGERLLPGTVNNNEKGFWEDIDFCSFNNELLEYLGYSWHSLRPILRSDLEHDNVVPFKLRAIALLREKLADHAIFGLKDPRTARLLPFWKLIFEHLDLDVAYVIAVRNPLSVANSLQKRDSFEVEKSVYLWLGHLIPSVLESEGSPRIVVDYDILMAGPQHQLFRIASALNLPFNESSLSINEYSKQFLTDDLRNTQFQISDLSFASNVPREVVAAYVLLRKLAMDELSIESPNVNKTFADLSQRMTEMRPAFEYMAKCESQISELGYVVGERDAQIACLNQEVTSKNHDVDIYMQQLQELQHQLSSKNGDISGYVQQILELQYQLDEILNSRRYRLINLLRNFAKMMRIKK